MGTATKVLTSRMNFKETTEEYDLQDIGSPRVTFTWSNKMFQKFNKGQAGPSLRKFQLDDIFFSYSSPSQTHLPLRPQCYNLKLIPIFQQNKKTIQI